MADTKKINIGNIELVATVNGKPADLIPGENLQVRINGVVDIELQKPE